MAAERRRRRPEEHGWASQRAVARHGGPGGRDAARAVVTLSASSASGRCSVSGVSVQCSRVPVHATGVQCPVRASERPGVRRPVWASGVRAFPCPLCPTGVRSWSAAVGQAAARLEWPGLAWSPAVSRSGSSAARVGAWCSKLRRPCWASGGAGLGPGCRPGRLGSGQVDRVADQDRRVRARISRR
jgi:hypothetical protein